MSQPDLQDVIASLLTNAASPLTTTEIAAAIAKKRIWHRPSDNQFPTPSQISARVNNYGHLFERIDGRIVLKTSANEVDRLFRLTWNTTGWQFPIKHKWRKANQGNSNIAFENQYGFGGEEWLFNPRYIIDGYQYGFIRGVSDLATDVILVPKAWLFSLNQETKERFLVGQINDLEVIKAKPDIMRIAEKLYRHHFEDVKVELHDVDADENGLDNYGLLPNVRFRLTGEELFEVMLPAPALDGHQYNRFLPYIVDDELQLLIDGVLPEDDFVFNPGVARNSGGHQRVTSPSVRVIQRIHSDISTALEQYLRPQFARSNKNISIEKTRFGDNIADVVLIHHAKEITILEIKTSGLARKNIREALGQLLDYGCWYSGLKIKKLIIVAPSFLSVRETAYFQRVKNVLDIPIGYWQYLPNAVKGQPEFEEII
ncbi:hypothetical protein [Mucilaginibacter ginsenosidivorax]|uniref:Uncharacterized protein n=1 Tax=Mucilaginibacter ginsenosidivorax TaxID=862126 RepID=A0A5B8W1V2_9SPHI|nr:hypothetical protein [Mucilaginibacter ginsenosidivorax]QEC76902.1 hypothetical protein FSB76_13465 [Mucilaginibacter ginsenosidivorax]